MVFKIQNFPEAITRTLRSKGFSKTSEEIVATIEAGRSSIITSDVGESFEQKTAYSPLEQQQICADLIEQNIILRYALWESSVLLVGGHDVVPPEFSIDSDIERLIQIVDDNGEVRQLGSFSYREVIDRLRDTVNRLRGMESPPTPTTPSRTPGGGSGGLSPPAKRRTRVDHSASSLLSATKANNVTSDSDARKIATSTSEWYEERAPEWARYTLLEADMPLYQLTRPVRQTKPPFAVVVPSTITGVKGMDDDA
ncbi:hypothetical protein ELI17_14655 [Rhizobium ruizarguesonis]|uniref:hypothetical protein n=1 Tax=Rhizobium ruizarguesonis TaxID=2081791 RepID=UPI00103073FF|nr:hypothetical protein [Rhizobium ruizarguesonis]TAW57487.1 hypothetical protein ELI17_14655 [Rhizobium ruizarguesonis]